MLKKPEFHRRQIPLFVLLGLVLALWVYTLADGYQMRRALETASTADVQTIVDGFGTGSGTETIKNYAANREYILFGNTTGTVTLFFKTPDEEGTPEYSGIVIGFEQGDDGWVMTESRGFELDEVGRAAAAFGDSV